MPQDFDEAYAEYQRVLILLSEAEDIPTKNARFRRLTDLLSEMEGFLVARAQAGDSMRRIREVEGGERGAEE